MITSVSPPGTHPDDVATAILHELRRRSPAAVAAYLSGGAVLIDTARPIEGNAVVAAAVDDDANTGRIIRYAAVKARRLTVPLRVVHVWTGRGMAAGLRLPRHDRMSDADRLLSAIVYDHLPAEEADAAEREILHDRDPVQALIDLSATASLIVLAARSGPATAGAPLGDTVCALIGRTACPIAVLPPAEGMERRFASHGW